MRYIILKKRLMQQGYCYCKDCELQCNGLFECIECPNVGYA